MIFIIIIMIQPVVLGNLSQPMGSQVLLALLVLSHLHLHLHLHLLVHWWPWLLISHWLTSS